MKRATVFVAATLSLVVSAAALGITAAVDTPSTLMSRVDFNHARNAIAAETRLAVAGCRKAQGAAREICKAETRATERVKLAELQARYFGTVAAAEEAIQVRATAPFEVARVRCSARTGEDRLTCLAAARADRTRALAEARQQAT